MGKIKSAAEKYPELQQIAEHISTETAIKINSAVKRIESKMPYKAQCVLEMVIQLLEQKV